jgi:hypothetical protein
MSKKVLLCIMCDTFVYNDLHSEGQKRNDRSANSQVRMLFLYIHSLYSYPALGLLPWGADQGGKTASVILTQTLFLCPVHTGFPCTGIPSLS